MKFVVVAAGKIRDRALRSVADDYLGRIQHYVRCQELEARHSSELERQLPSDAVVVALEVNGQHYTSEQFARRLEQWGTRGKGTIAFVIGGAEGIPSELSRRADVQLSLSSLTLPHRLARVILFEQLYRAMTILRGEPYAREG